MQSALVLIRIKKLATILRRHPLGLGKEDFPASAVKGIASLIQEQLLLRKALSEVKMKFSLSKSIAECFRLLQNHPLFGSDQKESEILALMRILQTSPPKAVCEIGTASGGTLLLLTQVCSPDAIFISIDIGLSFRRALVYSGFGTHRQRVVCIRGNSQELPQLCRMKSILKGHKLDLLFIDGDHSANGVNADFQNYSPLVRRGGLVALHDIVPDHYQRYGVDTDKYTGGVPGIWKALKSTYATEEFVEDPHQNGYGIGLVHL